MTTFLTWRSNQQVPNNSWWLYSGSNKPPNGVQIHPISLLVTVAMMQFQKVESRVGFNSESLEIQKREDYEIYGFNVQGLYRTMRGESREHLFVIKESIELGAVLYRPDQNESTKKLFELAKAGLEKMAQTYKNKTTADAITNWKELISTYCSNGKEPEGNLSALAEKAKTLWHNDEIDVINRLFANALNPALLESTQLGGIRALLDGKNSEWNLVLEKHST